MAQAGIASRRKSEELIKSGKIKVNGRVAQLGDSVESSDHIEYQGHIVKLKSEKIYLALNKPVGYISSTTSREGQSVLRLINIKKDKIYPVGRLDKNSSGLLLLTNDGDWANQIMHPRFGSEKEYFAVLDKPFKPQDKAKVESVKIIKEKKVKLVELKSIEDRRLHLILRQGLNRQIRKLLGGLDYRVDKLKRVRIGKLVLVDLKLKSGEWKFINKQDV